MSLGVGFVCAAFCGGDAPVVAVPGVALEIAGGCCGAPSTVTAVRPPESVTYFSVIGSKYDHWSAGSLSFFSLGITAISKVFVPLIPTSSSAWNFADGG